MKYLKRIFVITLALTMLLATPVFAKSDKSSEETLKQYVGAAVESIMNLSDIEYNYYIDNSYGWTSSVCKKIKSYKENDSLGEYNGLEFIEVKDDDMTCEVVFEGHFEKLDLRITTSIGYVAEERCILDMNIEQVDVSTGSLGERLANAGFNTIIGVTSVFLVLLLISFVISLFKYIPNIQRMFEKKKEVTVKESFDYALAHIEHSEEVSDDTELVAVIMAAICASTGKSADSFIVRSIKKAERKKKTI